VSPIAYKLITYLQGLDHGRNVVMEELVLTLGTSKTGIRAALTELEAEKYLTVDQEV